MNPEVTAKPDKPRKKYQKQSFAAVPRVVQPSNDGYERCSTISVNLRYIILSF